MVVYRSPKPWVRVRFLPLLLFFAMCITVCRPMVRRYSDKVETKVRFFSDRFLYGGEAHGGAWQFIPVRI